MNSFANPLLEQKGGDGYVCKKINARAMLAPLPGLR